ncbi:SART-1 protein [Lasallia pustulata]|uniref:SART-1 protein n=1 Tax=Lasallia pustulata TaxID=136370 RepID=A0A1W5CRB5_9LECA|nr:SART-1 protein [Lasallia pustulata]
MADSISIEETNKIRVAIGLKPLPVPGGGPIFKAAKDDESSSEEEQGSTLESRQAQGYDNWKKLQDQADAKAQREAKNEAIKKARDAARKHAKLEGKGLGEADDGTELDTKTWLIQQKKRQKKLEREKLKRLEKELAEREQIADHTAEDLAGVKVGHELGDFEDGGEQVLTLKDTTIDENEEEGDELENLDLKERERLNEKLELKKKKPVYNPNDVDESGEQSLLKHYDEAIDGKKRKRFTLDGQGTTTEDREAMKLTVDSKLKAQPISLDILKDVPFSDYLDASDTRIKKPRKKKAKSTRQRVIDEDEALLTMETFSSVDPGTDNMDIDSGTVDHPVAPARSRAEDTSFVDDDDLQAKLAAQRRAALKKRRRTRPEDIARQLREEASATPDAGGDIGNGDVYGDEEGGLVIDETSEFVANLQRRTVDDKARKSHSKPNDSPKMRSASPPAADSEDDVDMTRSYNDVEDDGDRDARFERESFTPATPGITGTGLEEEATLNRGIGATLTMLSQRGLIKGGDSGDLNALHRERQKFLAEKQKREADAERRARLQRERDRASGKLDRMSARDREEYARWENKQRDQQESRQMADIFNREYKPDVQLKYVDEFGRSMNQKEAFKHLSHQFHGKGSGKQKTEKHLKKIEDDKKREAMSTLDSSQATGMNNAMGATARKNRQAGVRLA